jgi:hypothetical protein
MGYISPSTPLVCDSYVFCLESISSLYHIIFCFRIIQSKSSYLLENCFTNIKYIYDTIYWSNSLKSYATRLLGAWPHGRFNWKLERRGLIIKLYLAFEILQYCTSSKKNLPSPDSQAGSGPGKTEIYIKYLVLILEHINITLKLSTYVVNFKCFFAKKNRYK